jgi:cell division protease FtsH
MNKNALSWLLPLCLAFLVFAGFDLYLSLGHTALHQVPAAAKEVTAADFISAVRNGEIADGQISYRPYVRDMADLTGTWSGAAAQAAGKPAATASWRTTARVTDADVVLLREHKFKEEDALTAASTHKTSARDLIPTIVRGGTQLFGFLLLGGVALMAIKHAMGKTGSFAVKSLKAGTSQVKFTSVAGCNEAKEEVSEIVEFLKDPARFSSTGARMPKGVLLVGPPGTGKTMLAKAVAGEAKAKFYSLSGSDFVELYVGVGASRVRSLFKKARETAPSIIFIDEIDAVGRKRSSGETGNQEHEQTLNALLVAMDGFGSDDAVVVFGATNRPETIDKALLRPGRFDRQVTVGLPDLEGRAAILRVHAHSVKLDPSVDLHEVAKTTSGFSGADLANLINEGALHAVRHRRATVLMSDLDEARDKISWGRENPRAMTNRDKKIIAYHEAGHALMQVISKDDALKLHKVTIIPRGQSLGSTQFTPERDLLNYSQEQLLARLQCLMAGRIAEEIALGSITSGASGDIQQASQIARQMVFEWGMSPLGFFAVVNPQDDQARASQLTFHEAESHVKKLLEDQYRLTTEQLQAHRAALDAIAAELIARETISGDDVRRLAAA